MPIPIKELLNNKNDKSLGNFLKQWNICLLVLKLLIYKAVNSERETECVCMWNVWLKSCD